MRNGNVDDTDLPGRGEIRKRKEVIGGPGVDLRDDGYKKRTSI